MKKSVFIIVVMFTSSVLSGDNQFLSLDSSAFWQPVDYHGHGIVTVNDGTLVLGKGETVTGVKWTGGELPTFQYEISFEAKRTSGNDFFCALTFPVDSSFATLVLGGWQGNVTGLSCINGMDAARNFTCTFMKYENQQWYAVRLEVTDDAVRAWVDDKRVVEVFRADGAFSLRDEMEICKPLGFASWKSSGEIRNIRLKVLKDSE